MSGPPGDFERFLLWERSSRDTLEIKRCYIDMAGDLVAGIVLSQIVYWHLPSRDGRTRLRVKRDGHLWLAKGWADWWNECRVSPKQADRALALLEQRELIEVRLFRLLEQRELIEVRLFRFAGAPTMRVRIVPEAFMRGWADYLGAAQGDFDQTVRSISPSREGRSSPAGEADFARRGRTYNTETTAQITAAAGPVADAARAESFNEEHSFPDTTHALLAQAPNTAAALQQSIEQHGRMAYRQTIPPDSFADSFVIRNVYNLLLPPEEEDQAAP